MFWQKHPKIINNIDNSNIDIDNIDHFNLFF